MITAFTNQVSGEPGPAHPDTQQFVGALNGQRASKGVFITTSTFNLEAVEYADAVNPRVILLDGRQLAELMIDHEVGVSVKNTYRIRRVDWTTSASRRSRSRCGAKPRPFAVADVRGRLRAKLAPSVLRGLWALCLHELHARLIYRSRFSTRTADNASGPS